MGPNGIALQAKQCRVLPRFRSLAALVAKRTVHLTVTGKDRYGRTLARVSVGGADACVSMVRQGMAWHFTKYSQAADLAAAEAGARKAKRGLWADKAPIAPWDWRKRKL